jgi:glucose-6-phosphate isomerase
LIPADYIAMLENKHPIGEHQAILLSNFFAQTEALMRGKNEQEVHAELESQSLDDEQINKLLPHKIFPGNKPSSSIFLHKLDPKTLGSLIAFYEHKVFVQGIVWNINSFDQWGVELGKQLAKIIQPELAGTKATKLHDSSTNNLINYYKVQKKKFMKVTDI